MDKKKMIIGAVLGVGLIAVLIYIFFFRKGVDGATTFQKVAGKKPNENDPLQKNIKNVSSGAGVFNQQVAVSSNTTNTNPFPLRKGSRNEYVKKLQQALNLAGFDTKGADGAWGNNTEAAFQQAFPGSFGVNDLKDLEEKISSLPGKVGVFTFLSNIKK